MALFGTIATVRAQAPQTAVFQAAFAHVAELLRAGSAAWSHLQALGVGESRRVELEHGVFAMDQVYATKPRAEGIFESHRSYIDLQVVIEGGELIEVLDLADSTVRQAYDAERDFLLHADSPQASTLRLGAGHAAILYPADVHMPSLRLEGEAVLVRKTVVKIPVG